MMSVKGQIGLVFAQYGFSEMFRTGFKINAICAGHILCVDSRLLPK
jgi:hypothetical protein